MRCFESLMKSSIELNTPTLCDPICFPLIFYQLLDQHNITVNLLNLCPFPEPNSRVLELYTHSFSSSFIQTVESSPDKILLSHPIRIVPMPRRVESYKILHYLWISEPCIQIHVQYVMTIFILITSFSNSALPLLPSLVDSYDTLCLVPAEVSTQIQ